VTTAFFSSHDKKFKFSMSIQIKKKETKKGPKKGKGETGGGGGGGEKSRRSHTKQTPFFYQFKRSNNIARRSREK
tara:strand:- start:241 stop:465 length:225 start_codon:yes stop_codon:yes gene_type:complete